MHVIEYRCGGSWCGDVARVGVLITKTEEGESGGVRVWGVGGLMYDL